MPTASEINAATDELYWLTYTGGQRAPIAAHDRQGAHNWWLARHFVESNWDALVANHAEVMADYASTVWANAAMGDPSDASAQRASVGRGGGGGGGRGNYACYVGPSGRGCYGWEPTAPISPIVGITLYHSVGDRDHAVEELNGAWNAFVAECFQKMGADPSKYNLPYATASYENMQEFLRQHATMMKSPYWSAWDLGISPTFSEWKRFYRDSSTWNEFLTSWEQYEGWYDKLDRSRKLWEEATHSHLQSVMPNAPPPTVFQQAGSAAAGAATKATDAVTDVWKTAKYILFGLLGVGGAIAIGGLVSDLKSNRDPTKKYIALAQQAARR